MRYHRGIVKEARPEDAATPRQSDVVKGLLDSLGQSFDMRTSTAAGPLGDVVSQRLRQIEVEEPPIWGTEGSIAQVAKRETEALDFYYRPHLFPEMSPELRLAHHLQFELLPRDLPTGCPLRVAAVLESYCHLSGDLIGWRQEGETFFLWIADMAGHGVRAGLAAAVFHFLVADLSPDRSLADLATELNERMFAARNPRDRRALYATAFMMRIDPDGRSCYTSGGHPPMLIRNALGEVSRLPALGPPIGLIPGHAFTDDALLLAEGDACFLYTDGLLEARSPTDEEFGTARIEALVQSTEGEPLEVSRSVYREVQEYKGTRLLDDDLTFLTARLT